MARKALTILTTITFVLTGMTAHAHSCLPKYQALPKNETEITQNKATEGAYGVMGGLGVATIIGFTVITGGAGGVLTLALYSVVAASSAAGGIYYAVRVDQEDTQPILKRISVLSLYEHSKTYLQKANPKIEDMPQDLRAFVGGIKKESVRENGPELIVSLMESGALCWDKVPLDTDGLLELMDKKCSQKNSSSELSCVVN